MDRRTELQDRIEIGAATAQTCGKTGPIVRAMLGRAKAETGASTACRAPMRSTAIDRGDRR